MTNLCLVDCGHDHVGFMEVWAKVYGVDSELYVPEPRSAYVALAFRVYYQFEPPIMYLSWQDDIDGVTTAIDYMKASYPDLPVICLDDFKRALNNAQAGN